MSNVGGEILSNRIGLRHGYQFREADFTENGIQVVKIGNVTDDGLNLAADISFVSELRIKEFESILIRDGDILMSLTGNIGRVVEVKNLYGKVLLQNYRVGVFYPLDEQIYKPFIKFILSSESILRQLSNHSNQSAQANFGKQDLDKLRFIIPSYLEQKKIYCILSTCDAVIEKTQAAIAKYKAIKQGMLQDLFTRGIDITTNQLRPRYQDAPHLYKESKLGWIPREWDEKVFGKEVDLIHGHQFRDYDFTEFGIPVVKIGQVKPENIDLSSCSFVAYGREDEFQNEIIRNGDVLMALTGATLGKACLVKGLNGVVLQNYRVGRFEPIVKENDIDKEFLYYLLIAGDLLTQIFNKVNTGAQGNIGKADFEKATFKKPPFDEQQLIASRLRAIDNKLQTEQTYLQKMQSIKKGLMEDLLSGKKQVTVTNELKEKV
jgi:type I restriction enzyme S subunit